MRVKGPHHYKGHSSWLGCEVALSLLCEVGPLQGLCVGHVSSCQLARKAKWMPFWDGRWRLELEPLQALPIWKKLQKHIWLFNAVTGLGVSVFDTSFTLTFSCSVASRFQDGGR